MCSQVIAYVFTYVSLQKAETCNSPSHFIFHLVCITSNDDLRTDTAWDVCTVTTMVQRGLVTFSYRDNVTLNAHVLTL